MPTIDSFSTQIKLDKWLRNLEDDLKPLMPYLEDKKITDLAIIENGRLVVEGLGMKKLFTDIYFDEATVTRIIYASAAILGYDIDPYNPIVEGTLPKWQVRIEGILKPRAAKNPMYFIRRPSDQIFSLENYLETGRITKERYDLLLKHIEKRSNIAIGGETGSGKTTLLNAIIQKMCSYTPDDRFYIVEDASEIQCHAHDVVRIFARGKDCLQAVGAAMRCNVSRIIFGEVRYGDVTNELFKAWNSGHTGGVTTVHANSALTMISRFRDLLREVIQGELPDISKSVQLLVHMIPTQNGPIVNEVIETSQITNSTFMEDLEENNLLN